MCAPRLPNLNVFSNNLWVHMNWISHSIFSFGASLAAQMVNNPPAMQETRVQSLSWEDPLEEGMATHSSILAWRIPWTEEPGELQSMVLLRVGHYWVTKHTHTHIFSFKNNTDYSWPFIPPYTFYNQFTLLHKILIRDWFKILIEIELMDQFVKN